MGKELYSYVVATTSDAADTRQSVRKQLDNIFVSAVVTEPAYVETGNERRFLIGCFLNSDCILLSTSTSQLVVCRVGERQLFQPPKMLVQ